MSSTAIAFTDRHDAVRRHQCLRVEVLENAPERADEADFQARVKEEFRLVAEDEAVSADRAKGIDRDEGEEPLSRAQLDGLLVLDEGDAFGGDEALARGAPRECGALGRLMAGADPKGPFAR